MSKNSQDFKQLTNSQEPLNWGVSKYFADSTSGCTNLTLESHHRKAIKDQVKLSGTSAIYSQVDYPEGTNKSILSLNI